MVRPLAILASLALLATAAQARIEPVLRIGPLVEQADLVIVGEVTRIDKLRAAAIIENGTAWPLSSMAADVRIIETLKGNAAPKVLRLEFVENDDPVGNGPQTASAFVGYQMLFLKLANETYRFANAVFGSVPLIRHCTANSPEAPGVYGRIVGRIGCAFFSNEATPQERTNSLIVLENEDSPAVSAIFAAALNTGFTHQNAELRQNLIAALLRANYLPAIPMAEQELFQPSSNTSTNGRSNILLGLQFVSPATSVPLLARALKVPEAELRQTAAQTLQFTNSQSAIDPLLGALTDPDPDVQFYVMQALANLTGDPYWRPNQVTKDAFWQECLNHWLMAAKQRAGN